MEFSSTIRVADLNDYIAPSQDCVVALNGKLKTVETSEEVQLQPRVRAAAAAPPGSLNAPAPGDPVKMSLHDCLACSGCITSAETVLLQQQSGDEFLAKLSDPRLAVVVTVSPQSRAALAAYFGLSPAATLARLAGWLRGLGAAAVWDLTTARDLVLLEEAAEFMDRFRASASGGSNGNGAGELRRSTQAVAPAPGGGDAPPGPLPMMASSCPGWVCYAEKTHGAKVIPYMSTTRSPQGAMGGLVKSLVAAAWGISPDTLYHVTVMPCYDKKLEASRDELTTSTAEAAAVAAGQQGAAAGGSDMEVDGEDGAAAAGAVAVAGGGASTSGRIAEVDCCLTTGEVLQLLQQRPPPGCSAQALLADPSAPCAAPDALLPPPPASLAPSSSSSLASAVAAGGVLLPPPDDRLYGLRDASSSGGYADYVFRAAARELAGAELPPGPLPWRALRNADFQELTLEAPALGPGQVLRFARVYGFRNIQTLLRQVKMGRCAYQYVEVMACPGGCLNGGGQPKPRAAVGAAPGAVGAASPQQLLEAVEAAYAHEDVATRAPADNPAVALLYGRWLGGRPGSAAARRLLHTSYREREKTVNTAMVANW
ncbi:hypothetical protein HYH02_009043 [Chlamydomonas schloesseri]|uniref:Iron hydrogenase small subunit domain-containing protein n=1 Tax=Chlamydomonas schloesseri TaxID=2026947 RepID=A0A835WB23_9CHLO|nr:hypothetical protein HYH02_009043 [Chlamydomonas schloesseri]|eukprot:KAG2444101.1 hypothetical protein HYH02_009043 [Chlamydomonas schloesseri]